MRKVWEFISKASHSRTTAILVILILFASVPLTVFIAQQRQQTKQNASETCGSFTTNQCNSQTGCFIYQGTQGDTPHCASTLSTGIGTGCSTDSFGLTTYCYADQQCSNGVCVQNSTTGQTGSSSPQGLPLGTSCRVGIDCASGVCGPEGLCVQGPYNCTTTATQQCQSITSNNGQCVPGWHRDATGLFCSGADVICCEQDSSSSPTGGGVTGGSTGGATSGGTCQGNGICAPSDARPGANYTSNNQTGCTGSDWCWVPVTAQTTAPAAPTNTCNIGGPGTKCPQTCGGVTSCCITDSTNTVGACCPSGTQYFCPQGNAQGQTCSSTPCPVKTASTTVTCTSSATSVPVNTAVTFTAGGGDNLNYTWTALTGGSWLDTNATRAQQNMASGFASPGTYSASVTSPGAPNSAVCTVTVTGAAGAAASPAGNQITLALSIGLDGIGTVGDRKNPTANDKSTKNPTLKNTPLAFTVLTPSGTKVFNDETLVYYDSVSGLYKDTGGKLLSGVAPGSYIVKVKAKAHLQKSLGTQNLVIGMNNIPSMNLVAGDIDGDNTVGPLDYNILVGCWFPDKNNGQAACGNHQQDSDLNGDGRVDQLDYNLMLREFGQSGDN